MEKETIKFQPNSKNLLLKAVIRNSTIIVEGASMSSMLQYWEVIETGESVTKYKKGDKLICAATQLAPNIHPAFVIENYNKDKHGEPLYAVINGVEDYMVDGWIKE